VGDSPCVREPRRARLAVGCHHVDRGEDRLHQEDAQALGWYRPNVTWVKRPGSTTSEREELKKLHARTSNCGAPTRFCVRHRRISHKRSSAADRSDGRRLSTTVANLGTSRSAAYCRSPRRRITKTKPGRLIQPDCRRADSVMRSSGRGFAASGTKAFEACHSLKTWKQLSREQVPAAR